MGRAGRPTIYDLELADIAQDRLLRRRRLRSNVTGNGSFCEDEYANLVACEVERAQKTIARMMEKRHEPDLHHQP